MRCIAFRATITALLLTTLFSSIGLALAPDGFIENRGQLNGAARYYAAGSRVAVFFAPDAIVLDLRERPDATAAEAALLDPADPRPRPAPPVATTRRGCVVYIRFENANPAARLVARGEPASLYHFFLGNDPDRWRSDVPCFEEIVYEDLWPGIDLVYRNEDGVITCEAVAGPGADPSRIGFRYEGASAVTAKGEETYAIETPVATFLDVRPIAGERPGGFVWKEESGGGVAPAPPDGPPREGLYLVWSTFLGGSYYDSATDVVTGDHGRPVVVGYTETHQYASIPFPTTPGAYQEVFSGGVGDAFVAKLEHDGSDLRWCTLLGGYDCECAHAVTLDSGMNVFVTGDTHSTNFPIEGSPYQPAFAGGGDVFVARLSTDGSTLLWSTYLGGEYGECATGIGLSVPYEHVFVAGHTGTAEYSTPPFPVTSGAFDTSYGGGFLDGFLFKLTNNGQNLLWCTFLGGQYTDYGSNMTVDDAGDPVVVGHTSSPDFPVSTTTTPADASQNGDDDVFVCKLTSDGISDYWGTFLGGEEEDYGYAVSVGTLGHIFVTGTTASSESHTPPFPITPGAFDDQLDGELDAFIARFDSELTTLVASTYLGSYANEGGRDIVAIYPYVWVTGYTFSIDFPTTADVWDDTYNLNGDVFLSAFNSLLSDTIASTFLGGESEECGNGLSVFPSPDGFRATVVGYTESSNFPATTGAWDEIYNHQRDAFVSQFKFTDVVSAAGEAAEPEWLDLAVTADPARSRLTIRYAGLLSGAGTARLYDAGGRLVRSYGLTAQEGVLSWDGRNAGGRAVASGIYFLRVTDGAQNASRRVVWVR